jgi:hypothetical protein
VFLPDSIAIAAIDAVCYFIYLFAKVDLTIGYNAIQLGHILVQICCFHMNTENSDAPLIASGLQFLLQHQADNGGLPGQGLAPCVPTSKKIIGTVFCIYQATHERNSNASYLNIAPH